jgi:hypothetical protein
MTGLAPTEYKSLLKIAELIFDDLVETVSFTVFYGAYLILTVITIWILWERKGAQKFYKMPLFMAVVFIAMTTTSLWLIRTINKVHHIQIGLQSANTVAFAARYANIKQWSTLGVYATYMDAMNVLYADAILIWRLRIICPENRVWAGVAMVLWVMSLAAELVSCIALSLSHTTNTFSGYFLYAGYAALGLSFITNMVATTVISVRVWRHKQESKMLGTVTQLSNAGTIGLLLVESGFVYAIIQLTVFLLLVTVDASTTGPHRAAASTLYQIQSGSLSPLYPTLVILIVSLKKSVTLATKSSSAFSTGNSSSTAPSAQRIVFAPTGGRSYGTGTTDSQGGMPMAPMDFTKRDEKDY